MKWIVTDREAVCIPLELVCCADFPHWCAQQTGLIKRWVQANQFQALPHTHCVIPNAEGSIDRVLVGVKSYEQAWALGHCAYGLPPGRYKIVTKLTPERLSYLAMTWGLGAYHFGQYRTGPSTLAQLQLSADIDQSYLVNLVNSHYWVRDLINTPASDMNPQVLAKEAQRLAQEQGADYEEIVGDELLARGFTATYAVGQASAIAPRMIQLSWGRAQDPSVVLIGKGVCFDSGGLDIKPSQGMLLMKKDMGGAAHVLGLAQLIMRQQLRLNLHVFIPAVENVIAGNAFKPGDVISMRDGQTIEVGNTDAEGRLILADALIASADLKPALIIDMATLTGAARVAVGVDIAAYFTNNDRLATDLQQLAQQCQEAIWRLPLYDGYETYVDSRIAHINNASKHPYAGAILAGLLLQRFVPSSIPWLHFDMMAWNINSRPGRPEGGEAMVLRSVYEYLAHHFQG